MALSWPAVRTASARGRPRRENRGGGGGGGGCPRGRGLPRWPIGKAGHRHRSGRPRGAPPRHPWRPDVTRTPSRIPAPRPPRSRDPGPRRRPGAVRTIHGRPAGARDGPPTRPGAAPGPPPRSCREEETVRGLGGHPEQEPPVGKAGDIGRPVGALAIADGNLHDAEVELGRAEDQIEIAEGIKVAEMRPAGREPRVVVAPDDLGAAQRVLDRLADEQGKEQSEEAIAEEVEEAHGLRIHAIDEARAHGELPGPRDHGLVELRQVLGGDGEIGIEDHQHVACGVGEAQPDRVALALAALREDLDVPLGIAGDHAAALLEGAVARMALDEDELRLRAEPSEAPEHPLDIPLLVATRTNDGDAWGLSEAS